MKNITAIDYEDQPTNIHPDRGIYSKIYPLYKLIMDMPFDTWGGFKQEYTKEEVRRFRNYLGENKENRSRIYQDYMKANNCNISVHCEKNGKFYKVWVKKIKKP